ncbi:MAG: TonB-dependent receptor [Prolixibacteraceae bacterium]|nr:TonB-dependent receptor [Prolixibacteraceae bacterium]
MRRLIPLILFAIIHSNSFAQSKIDTSEIKDKTFELGEILVSKVIDKETIPLSDMKKFNSNDVSSSLRTLPSVMYYNSGSRNESMVFIRGFDVRSVPVFVDGIPVYVPYDGYVDLARFTTFDISRIDVSKGYSSIMYGANTLGGAINLIGVKPSEKLEVKVEAGVISGNGYISRIGIGSNLGKIYMSANFSILDKMYIPLSEQFDTIALEKNLKLDNSFSKDIKGSLKLGYTPNESDEYSISYSISHGNKGNPIYLGNDPNTKVRYWQWPNWDKQNLYYISKTAINEAINLKIRMFYDEFKNKISSFDDNTYTTQTKKSSFNSYYYDYTLGGNIEFGYNISEKNTIKMSAHIKNDNHRENNEGEPSRHSADNTVSIGIEDIYSPYKKITIIPGVSYNLRNSIKAEDYDSNSKTISLLPKNSNDALNAQIATYYNISGIINANFNIAYKNRFATMKDRYSYRAGFAIPNPDLISESALNIELGANLLIGDNIKIRPELFYNRIFNTIQIVNNVKDYLYQMQNTGTSEYKGADLTFTYKPLRILTIYGVYSYIKCLNISNPEILFTDIPENKVFASIEIIPIKNFFISISGEYNSKRYSTSNGSRVSAPFFIANAELKYKFAKCFDLSFGIKNITDNNYTLQEGYPEPGRNLYASLLYNFSK